MGLAVTSASAVIYGAPIIDPVDLLGRLRQPAAIVTALSGLLLATLTTNIAANVVRGGGRALTGIFVALMCEKCATGTCSGAQPPLLSFSACVRPWPRHPYAPCAPPHRRRAAGRTGQRFRQRRTALGLVCHRRCAFGLRV